MALYKYNSICVLAFSPSSSTHNFTFIFDLSIALSGQDVDRNRKVIDGGALDGKKRQEDEIKQLKEKFKRARNVLEEREEHSRKEESEKFINNLDKLRKEVEKQRRELNENHQRTLSQTIRNNNDKKKKFEKQINDENILWENNFRSKIRKNKVNDFLFFLFYLFFIFFSVCFAIMKILLSFIFLFPGIGINIFLFIDKYFLICYLLSISHILIHYHASYSLNGYLYLYIYLFIYLFMHRFVCLFSLKSF